MQDGMLLEFRKVCIWQRPDDHAPDAWLSMPPRAAGCLMGIDTQGPHHMHLCRMMFLDQWSLPCCHQASTGTSITLKACHLYLARRKYLCMLNKLIRRM